MFGVKLQLTPVISAGPKNLISSADMTLCTADQQLRDTGSGEGVMEYVKTPNKAFLLIGAQGDQRVEDTQKADGHQYSQCYFPLFDAFSGHLITIYDTVCNM